MKNLEKYNRAFMDIFKLPEDKLPGLSYQDIAQRLGKDAKAVDNAVQRIRRKMARDPNFGDISAS